MFSKRSFQFRLQAALGLMIFVSLLNAGVITYRLNEGLQHDKMDLLTHATESISDKVDRNLFERYGDVQAFALSEPARSGDPVRIMNFMADMMGAYAPIYDVMLVVDKSGKVIAVNSVDKSGKNLETSKMIGKNYADQDWFKAAMDGKIPAGSAHFSDLRIDSDTAMYTGADGSVMTFTSAIRDPKSGEVLGVWSNRMSWKDVVVDTLTKESQKLKDENIHTISAYLVNDEGTFLSHRDSKEVLSGKLDSFASYPREKSWAHKIDDKDEIKEASIEVFASAKGFSAYPGLKWTYVLRGPVSDPRIVFDLWASFFGGLTILGMALVAVLVTRKTSRQLETVIERLREGSSQVSQTANDVTGASYSLSEASTEQASALQETAASIEEINAMIKKSSENATRSQDVAGKSSEIAKRGKMAVDQMSEAINEINVSNESILRQISESNGQISEIAKVIAEIGNKTKVINDIVFQTKLLSFNASVEAARAGEHGKGFAVVAEEVGNLAQMSGNAAKEISEMLAASIKKVEAIVDETKMKVERLISDGRQKVQSGIVIAEQCGSVLNDVVVNVDELNVMVTEITVASHEQSQGVNEITKAMNELDQTTHANAATSQHVSGYANSLSEESKQMNEIVGELIYVVRGSGGSSSSGDRHVGEKKKVSPVKLAVSNKTKAHHSDSSDQEEEAPKVRKLKKVSGDSTPSSEDPRFKDV
jgi:methyl-accepting chemotaxis protein